MNEELFASVYVDECLSPLLAEILRKEGWHATSAFEKSNLGKSDNEQLLEAVKFKAVLITSDKSTFVKETYGIEHFGLIMVSRSVPRDQVASVARKVSELLNKYTADEFRDVVFFIS